MSHPDQPTPPDFPPGSDELRMVRQFKQEPIRAGCFGCMLSGWGLLAALAALTLLAYLAVAVFRS